MATISRRELLKVTAAGSVLGLVGLNKRLAHAGNPSPAKRALLLYADGGLRSTAGFAASSKIELNPFGVLGTYGAFRLGKLFRGDDSVVSYDAPSWNGFLSQTGVKVPPIDVVAKSWALVAARDHNLNPDLERSMAKHAGAETIEVPGSHAVYVSKPNDVARLIERAAKASAQ